MRDWRLWICEVLASWAICAKRYHAHNTWSYWVGGVGVSAVNKHLKHIFESGDLDSTATVSKMEMVRSEGGREVTRAVEMYNLDAIDAHDAVTIPIPA